MKACATVLGLSKDIKGQLLDLGILEVLIPLTNSVSVKVQGNSAAAIGNLSSKGKEVFEDCGVLPLFNQICYYIYTNFFYKIKYTYILDPPTNKGGPPWSI
ncbi:hypothetical protein BY996DRAFT_4581057 [Phakopsora pachyrhizi]|uniref:Uncharacterized protein n=1 Tax=Phakopsora pachyrhizi TaxID=170000 RepID=A0AAV0BFA5_PHAPC|nr:hypothetical protein BY996DRAFT_4581057 [Phakopsora pachyrhizi]CAH7685618.1 hypothetical protein PPACK8108_LOCUS20183 [Phakopsora pachyrhizi]